MLKAQKQELLALASLPGMDRRKLGDLLVVAGTPAEAWERVRLGSPGFVPRGGGEGWTAAASRVEPSEIVEILSERGIKAVVRGEAGYPPLLEQIYEPPWVLYHRGDIVKSGGPGVALVGSRRASAYGLEAAEWLARGLASEGLSVVSGAAYGIDAAAHRGALTAGGFTCAVLGTGVDEVYPRSNSKLIEMIGSRGCLISEYQPGTPPRKHHFPERNRIISGLSTAVVVVEAADGSGALITAEFALGEGRDVMAVPGPIFSDNSVGTNRLIRNGAVPVTSVEDVLQELGLDRVLDGRSRAEACEGLRPEEKKIVEQLRSGERQVESLAGECGMRAGDVLAVLSALEVRGLVSRTPGGAFRLSPALR